MYPVRINWNSIIVDSIYFKVVSAVVDHLVVKVPFKVMSTGRQGATTQVSNI